MRRGVSGAVGLLLGAAAGVALIYYNPLTQPVHEDVGRFDDVWRYELPADAAAITHSGRTPLPMHPGPIAALWERGISRSILAAMALSSEDGDARAVGSRISVPSERTELLQGGLLLNDYWLVTLPGEGSLFIVGDSNVWPLYKEHILPVRVLKRPWRGPSSFVPTEGPGIGATAIVLGATLRFADREGSAVERLRPSRVGPAGLEALSGALHVRLLGGPAPEQAAPGP